MKKVHRKVKDICTINSRGLLKIYLFELRYGKWVSGGYLISDGNYPLKVGDIGTFYFDVATLVEFFSD